MSAVRIENDAWNDWRFAAVGAALYPGMDRADATDIAMLRFFRVVSQCTDRGTYALPIEAVDAICGHGYALALIHNDLAESMDDGSIRIHGTSGRIEWLHERRKAGRKGGKLSGKVRANKAEASAKQNEASASAKSNPTATATATVTTTSDPEETSPRIGVDGVEPPALELGEPPPPRVTPADLECVYKLYPRKEGKAKGLKKAREAIRTPADLEAFRSAVTNYAELMRREGRELRHVKAFDTFVGCWVDYLDPAVLTPPPMPTNASTGYVKVTGREQYRGGDVEDF